MAFTSLKFIHNKIVKEMTRNDEFINYLSNDEFMSLSKFYQFQALNVKIQERDFYFQKE